MVLKLEMLFRCPNWHLPMASGRGRWGNPFGKSLQAPVDSKGPRWAEYKQQKMNDQNASQSQV
jgi:hypothetical protein